MGPGADSGIALLVFGALGVTTMVVLYRWREKSGGLGRVPPPDPADAHQRVTLRDEDYDLVLRGTASVNGVTVTGGRSRLLVTRDQAELRAFFALEPIRFSRAEVTGLLWVPGPFGGRKLKFRTASGRLDNVTFWPRRNAEEQLAELGWY
ncbi:hypothetical protein [Amycolatopsis vastitatis]|uniref:Uncharacterized protein n=1 Tax=Amycolatopsis vastitatis TaxID=1905142 RepID=A0A229T0P1_9PSEU|nr:hypothetical protein [Amycolatopsis vastitatis]OXM64491.1 hypothetical protein CF165_26370 [Amycolatopsis vastitatis]